MNWIIEDLNGIAEWLYDFHLDHYDEVWPMYWLADIAEKLSRFFNWLAWDFSEFFSWLLTIADQLGEILSWSNIRSKIYEWLPDLEDAIEWWDRWWVWVGQEIDDWWRAVRQDVKDWIDIATEGLDNLIADWHNFWVTIYPDLVKFEWLSPWWESRWQDINTLINNWLKLYAPFWEGWQEVRSAVIEFINDPLQWFYDRLEQMFDRFW